MIKKRRLNQSGFTLLEVLVTLAISTIVIGVISTVLITTIKYNDKTQSHINIRQEANLIITQMRQQHQGEKYNLCFNKIELSENVTMEELKINNINLNGSQCEEIDPRQDLLVQFTVSDDQNNTFEIDTVIEARRKSGPPIAIGIEKPVPNEDIFTFLKNNHIFVYGSNLNISGSTLLNSTLDDNGTLVINNDNHSDLIFSGGGNQISLENIYISKQGNKVNFTNSTKLGETGITNIVSIKGDVLLDRGTAAINGETIYIDGNVTFEDAAKINGEVVFISGDVVFNNWSALIDASKIYIGGEITYVQPGNINGDLYEFGSTEMPDHPLLKEPTLHENSWYASNGYELVGDESDGVLHNGSKIFANSYTSNQWHRNTNDVVIISKGDITIKNFGGSSLTGVLIAPYGKVTFNGASFEGVIIAKDVLFPNGGTNVAFRNIEHYFSDANEFPLK